MEIRILNKDFQWEYTIDRYSSFIWTERYQDCGDFEIYIPMKKSLLDHLKFDYYVEIDDSDRTMIIETLQTVTDPDSGDMLIVSGRDLTSILDRRVDAGNTYLNKSAALIWADILNRCFITGQSSNTRIVSNFKAKKETEYTGDLADLIAGKESIQIYCGGRGCFDIIKDIVACLRRPVGFKITLTEDNEFYFEFYEGIDRSYNQIKNPSIIFSNNFGNLYGSTFTNSKKDYKNQAWAHSDSVSLYVTNAAANRTISRTLATISDWTTLPSGLELRELAVDCSNVQNNTSATNYNQWDNAARSEGLMQLGRHKIKNDFEGEGEDTSQWVYRKDYFLGDIVQLEDRYGNSGAARIVEYIFSDDTQNGVRKYPTFDMV